MTTLAIYSDLHLEFGEPAPVLPEADILVLAGDIATKGHGVAWAIAAAAGRPVVYVAGNHECYGATIPRLYEKLRATGAPHGVHVLERDAVVIGGVRFLGATLWTDFGWHGDRASAMALAGDPAKGMNDYVRTRLSSAGYRKLRPQDTAATHAATLAWLRTALAVPFAGPTVVVTHHAPVAAGCDPATADDPYTPAYVSRLEAFVAQSGAALWIHGHTHWAHDTMVGGTRVVSNARGYPGAHPPGYREQFVLTV